MLAALFAGVEAELATSIVLAVPATAPPVDAGCGFALSVGALVFLLTEGPESCACTGEGAYLQCSCSYHERTSAFQAVPDFWPVQKRWSEVQL